MELNFIFSHLNAIVLAIWIIFLIIVAIRYFRPTSVKNISYFKLVLIALGFDIFYGVFVLWGQYFVWANGSLITKALLTLPLSKEVPLPYLLEWIRPFFEQPLGYFLFYVLGRTWLNIFISVLISAGLYFIFKIWNFYRGGFMKQGPEVLLVLMLIAGFPGVLVMIPLGFIFAILLFGFYYLKGKMVINIEPAFILATLFALLFTRIILSMLQ